MLNQTKANSYREKRLSRTKRFAIRGGSGLGDSLYLQAISRHLVLRGFNLSVCTNYPEIFSQLGDRVELQEFKRIGVDFLAHYSQRRHVLETTQFEDCCLQARIDKPVELKLDWKISPNSKHMNLLAQGKPIAVVGMPRAPMGREDGLGKELLPNMAVYQQLVSRMRDGGYLIVQVGSGNTLHGLHSIDVDLSNQTSVSELIDVVSIADAVICYPSFLVPLAESLDKRFATLFSVNGLECYHNFLRFITPQKIIHRKDLGAWAIDNQEETVRNATAHFFR